MSIPLTQAEAEATLAGNSRLYTCCSIAQEGMKTRHRGRAAKCAAYLADWLDEQVVVGTATFGAEAKRETVDRLTGRAFEKCQRVGLIPEGIVTTLIWRLILWPFLQSLIEQYLFGGDS